MDVTDDAEFSIAMNGARDANLVNIYCHEGGDCGHLGVECPDNNLNDSCRTHCDDDSTTECRDTQLYSTNGYCKDVTSLCIGMLNQCLIDSSKIYFRYNQITNLSLIVAAVPEG